MKWKMLVLTVAVLAASALAGCGPPGSVQAELRAQAALSVAVESYAATVGVLKQAAGNGLLSDEDCLRIEIVRQRVRAALNSWRVALAADQPPEEAIADFRRELALLLAEQAKLKEPKP